jgi:hypothetical protein
MVFETRLIRKEIENISELKLCSLSDFGKQRIIKFEKPNF